MPVTPPADFDAFLRLSARVGGDPLLTQGAGGNTSIKEDGITWIKASGTWLAEALDRPIMVPVRTNALIAALHDDPLSVENPVEHIVAESNPSGLRPSIETAFHCLMPQRVVAHYHSVDAMALLVCADRSARVAAAMATLPALRWQMIDYRRPGAPLAVEIATRLRPDTDVLFLANHGIVVGADTVDEVSARIARLNVALAQPVRPLIDADHQMLAKIAATTGMIPATDRLHHSLGTDPVSYTFARAGVLVPDQAIFLGASLAFDPADLSCDPALLVIKGAGTLMRPTLSAGAVEMAGGVAELLRRLPADAALEPLSASDVNALLNWDAEKYRQSLDRAAS